MKILQLIYSLGNGGAEKFAVELSNELARNHEVVLYTFKPNENWMLPAKKISPHVQNRSLGITSKKNITNWFASYRMLKNEKPDVVHIHSSLLMFYMYFMALFFPKIKFVQTIHNTLTPSYKKLFKYLVHIPYVRSKWMHVCISKQILKDFVTQFPKLNFYHIDNGVAPLMLSEKFDDVQNEIDQIKTQKRSILLIAIGNYSDFKRFDLLVEVVNSCTKNRNDLHLIILGEDTSEGKINYNKVMNLMGENVHLLGLKSNIADYLQLSDAFIMSSSMEGMPLVLIEAMSLGKPIISTPAGGIVDMVTNGNNGFLAKDLSKEALIEALNEYLNCDNRQIEKISKNNRGKFNSSYSIAISTQKYENLIANKNE